MAAQRQRETMNTPSKLQGGKVWLVGAGPGDPELLTLKAARLISQADAIVYDHLVGNGIMDLARGDARIVYAGKESSKHTMPQEDINQLLVELAREGLSVVRLKGDARRIIPAIFQPAQPIQKNGAGLPPADVANDAAHGL